MYKFTKKTKTAMEICEKIEKFCDENWKQIEKEWQEEELLSLKEDLEALLAETYRMKDGIKNIMSSVNCGIERK